MDESALTVERTFLPGGVRRAESRSAVPPPTDRNRILERADPTKRIDQNLIQAISHPLRVWILELLSEGDRSPKELAAQLSVPLSNTTYHVSALKKAGCLEEVRTEKRRGAVEHFFRAIPRSFVGHWDWHWVPRPVRGAAAATSLGTFVEAAALALGEEGIAEADETTIGWATIPADRVGRVRLGEIGRRAIREAERVHEESRRRSRASGETLAPVLFALHIFAAGIADEDP